MREPVSVLFAEVTSLAKTIEVSFSICYRQYDQSWYGEVHSIAPREEYSVGSTTIQAVLSSMAEHMRWLSI